MSEKEDPGSRPSTGADWAGETGDKYAEWNPTTAEGCDKMFMEWYSVKASDVTKRAFEGARKEGGLVIDANTTALDIGCNTGGMLDILETVLGFSSSNLHGVDLSPSAVERNRKAHPEYKLKVISGYDYEAPQVDIVYHTGVLCQVRQQEYEKFYAKVKETGARYYMFIEGINPRGYEEIPNSAADHLGHRHSHGHHADNKDGEGEVASIPLHEGYHYTDDHQRVAEEHLPKPWKKVFSERIDYPESAKGWMSAFHFDYGLCNVYKIGE